MKGKCLPFILHPSAFILLLSRVLDDDGLDDVGGLLAAVDGGFELVVDVLPADDADGVGRALEEVADGLVVEVVAFVFEAVYLDEAGRDAGRARPGRDDPGGLDGPGPGHLAEPGRGVRRLPPVVP